MDEEAPFATPGLSISSPSRPRMSYGTISDSRMGGSNNGKDYSERGVSHEAVSPENTDTESAVNVQKYDYDESRKIGITGATFLILNKMIGTGSELIHPRRHRAVDYRCRWARAC